jgi:hypothetical protein
MEIDIHRVRGAIQAYRDGFMWLADAERLMIRAGMDAKVANAMLIEVAVESLAGLETRRSAPKDPTAKVS